LIKPLEREICLDENLLRNIFHIFLPLENTSGDGKDAVLMPANQELESILVAFLGTPNNLPFVDD
jgi:hypothetical protein